MGNKPLCIILMGSSSDMAHAEIIEKAVKDFGLDVEVRIGSAHKTPAHVLEMLKKYEAMPRPKVYITIAGRSNALSGFVDACVSSPSIACPPKSESFAGADLYSSIRMPSGVAPAFVLEPKNAALLAAKIMGTFDADIKSAVEKFMKANADKVISDDANLK